MSALRDIAISAPVGWTREIPEPGPKNTSCVLYHAPGSVNAKLGVVHRPYTVPQRIYDDFIELLARKPFILTPSQVIQIADVLGSMQYDFKVLVCRTVDVAGRRVLQVEGRWWDDSDSQALILPGNPEQADVYEVFFRAAKGQFPVFLPAARKAFSSINWQRQGKTDV